MSTSARMIVRQFQRAIFPITGMGAKVSDFEVCFVTQKLAPWKTHVKDAREED